MIGVICTLMPYDSIGMGNISTLFCRPIKVCFFSLIHYYPVWPIGINRGNVLNREFNLMINKENDSVSERFWEHKTLEQMTNAEWEAVCDCCGLCCLTKLQDDETDEIGYTRVVCSYSDPNTAQCTDYANRSLNVPACVQLTRERVAEFDWLPDTCAYRILYRGQALPDWHPLVSGRRESVAQAGVGLLAIPVVVDNGKLDYEDYLVDHL